MNDLNVSLVDLIEDDNDIAHKISVYQEMKKWFFKEVEIVIEWINFENQSDKSQVLEALKILNSDENYIEIITNSVKNNNTMIDLLEELNIT